MKKMNTNDLNILKKSIERMSKSDEQFIFMIFKNKDGTDNITEYSYNMNPNKIIYYWEKASKRAVLTKGEGK